eukprot:m51a1_g12275 hypothetical protein (724) ;mRNA; r:223135-226759
MAWGVWGTRTRQFLSTDLATYAPVMFFLCSYQFLHAFNPGSSFNVQAPEEKGMANKVLYSSVLQISAYCMVPATLATGLVLYVAGYRAALVLEALALVACDTLFAAAPSGHPRALMSVSQAFGSFSFGAGFLVTCALFSLVPKHIINSVAMMMGIMGGSLVGQAVLPAVGSYTNVLVVGAGCSVVCLEMVLVGIFTGALPPAGREFQLRQMLPGIGRAFARYHRHAAVTQWSLFSSVTLALHTINNKAWKSLLREVDAQAGSKNGFISATSYGVASGVLFLAALVPVRATRRVARPVIWFSSFALAALFFGLSQVRTDIRAAVGLIVAYNAVAELLLMVASVMLGEEMRLVDAAAATVEEINCDEETAPLQSSKSVKAAQARFVDFAVVFTFNYVVSIAIQNLFLFVVGDRALNLEIWGWYYGLAGSSVLLSVVMIRATGVEPSAQKIVGLVPATSRVPPDATPLSGLRLKDPQRLALFGLSSADLARSIASEQLALAETAHVRAAIAEREEEEDTERARREALEQAQLAAKYKEAFEQEAARRAREAALERIYETGGGMWGEQRARESYRRARDAAPARRDDPNATLDFRARCTSLAASGLQDPDSALECSNRVVLPKKALDDIVERGVVFPVVFRVRRELPGGETLAQVHAAVLDFTAPEGTAYMCECGSEFEQRALQDHMRAECSLRPVRCSFCDMWEPACEIQRHELDAWAGGPERSNF